MNKILQFPKHKTAGELAVKANQDQTVYDSIEVGHALTEDVLEELQKVVQKHDLLFGEDEYFVVIQLAGDPLLATLMRRKFYAYLYMPDPRPRQTVFLYSKAKQRFLKRLWVLPDVISMETFCEITNVAPKYQTMQNWSKAFYAGKFWELIRQEAGISHLSKSEYLEANRAKLVEATGNKVEVLGTDAFDFSKVAIQKVIDPYKPVFN
jgi:hypothetical protein